MPMWRRTAFSSTPGAVTSWPQSKIRPRLTGSRRFTHRSSVDLPDPDAPMRQMTSWGATDRSIPRRTSRTPNDLWDAFQPDRLLADESRVPAQRRVARAAPPNPPVASASLI